MILHWGQNQCFWAGRCPPHPPADAAGKGVHRVFLERARPLAALGSVRDGPWLRALGRAAGPAAGTARACVGNVPGCACWPSRNLFKADVGPLRGQQARAAGAEPWPGPQGRTARLTGGQGRHAVERGDLGTNRPHRPPAGGTAAAAVASPE